jgi:hypothetical protein
MDGAPKKVHAHPSKSVHVAVSGTAPASVGTLYPEAVCRLTASSVVAGRRNIAANANATSERE